jgi:hypothetical protein
VLLGTEWLLALAIGALGAAAFALVWLATQMHTPQTPDPDGDGEGPA